MAIAATMLMSASVMAQDNTQARRERGQFNPEEMAQRRTDDMVKTYGLNEEQAAKLLELNKKRGQQMMSMRRDRGPRMRPEGGEQMRRPEGRERMSKDSLKLNRRPPVMKDGEQMPERPRMENAERGASQRNEMRKQMEEYDNALKEIMTEEQFNAYRADMQKRMQDRPRGMGRPERAQEQQ